MPDDRHSPPTDSIVTLRTELRPGDLGAVIGLHGTVYAREHGFDHTFEAYVAGPLAVFARRGADRERIWLAEREGRLVGCVAIVGAAATAAQLRWFLVAPSARGAGLGRRLLKEAVAFAEGRGYRAIILWTVRSLEAAGHLYHKVGFRVVEEKPGRMWGVEVVEERYELALR